MAALYLHNALFSPQPPPTPHTRSRTISTASTHTLRPSGDFHHPTESLMTARTSESVAFKELLQEQPRHPEERGRRMRLSLVEDREGGGEADGTEVTGRVRRKMTWAGIVRFGLEVIIGTSSDIRSFG
jgi:hypothetical protein